MPVKIVIEAEGLSLEGALDDSETAVALAARLPLEVSTTSWGEEYYGDIGDPLGVDEAADAREEMEVGELAYWPPGNAFCVFFGPTPASVDDRPRAASAVNPVGMIDGAEALTSCAPSLTITIRAAES